MPDASPLLLIQLTPPGRGAVASLRIEGPGALDWSPGTSSPVAAGRWPISRQDGSLSASLVGVRRTR